MPARSTPTTTIFSRAYFHDMKSPVQVDITSASAVAAKNILMGNGLGADEAESGAGRSWSFELLRLSFCGSGRSGFSRRKMQGTLLMQLRKMNEDCGRDVRTPTGGLVEAEHLKASGDGEKENRRREEHAYIVMCQAYRL